MASKETGKCAFHEGFAHFYAADVFNDHGDTSCSYEYSKNEFGSDSTPEVNCESANGDFHVKYMETDCHVGGMGGYGVELDWMRTFWDMHTDYSLTFNDLVEWMDDAEPWGTYDAYDELDEEANTIGGTLNTAWDWAKALNGIDH